MKTIGLLGGMSYESTLEYYKKINQAVQKKLGKSHSAKIYMYSFDYEELIHLNDDNKHDTLTKRLYEESHKLKNAGADLIALTANTTHLYISNLEKDLGIKLIHIVDASIEEAKRQHLNKLLLLGTKYTMSSDLYHQPFFAQDKVIVTPNGQDQQWINDMIYNELTRGIFLASSKQKLIEMIDHYHHTRGFDGVILGCTELPLIIKKEDLKIPLINTIDAHVLKIVDEIFKD